MSIYVETLIRAPMDALWAHTQTPALHERWDLRFSTIEYLPRIDPGLPQRFRYTTRIGFGSEVSGEGETIGSRDLPDGSSSSALRFWSDAPLSVIREGSGYWKYIPTPDGVRFLTWYDYGTRFGAAGEMFDRTIFRPLMGWATAWSFDRLRLWLEDRIDPRVAVRHTLIHLISRLAIAAVFAQQGSVPSLAVAVALFAAWFRSWPLWVCLAAIPMAAFDPFSLNISIAALAAADLLVVAGIPSAGRCRRHPEREEP